MKKKLAALVLAATMVIASGLTVFAEDAQITGMGGAGEGTKVTGDSTMQLPTIKITVPTTANIVINPFKMEYNKDGLTGSSQIISAKQQITNKSDVAVDVNVVDLCAKPGEGITMSATDLAGGKVTTKSAFLYLEVAEETKLSTTGYTKAVNQIVIPAEPTDAKGKKASKDAVVTLAAGTESAPTKADFTIGGSVVANPVTTTKEGTVTTTEANPWVDGDSIAIEFKFTFTPKMAEAAK